MTDDELIAQLCVLIMEDVCVEAVTARPHDREELKVTVERLHLASQRISALINCARVLTDEFDVLDRQVIGRDWRIMACRRLRFASIDHEQS